MLDLNIEAERKAFEEASYHARTMAGTNFCLVMRQEDGSLTVHPRPNQPCQGGEMRKYETSHPGDCTRPNDPRPNDLKYPFPSGTPEAVSIHWNSNYLSDEFFNDLIDFSPYRKLFTPNSVRNIYRGDNSVQGSIFLNTDVDSTAFVNFLQFVGTVGNLSRVERYYALLDFVEPEEAMAALYLDVGQLSQSVQGYPYYFSTYVDTRRLLEGDFRDLTGGTLRNRFDYNRPEVQDLFKVEYPTGVKPKPEDSFVYVCQTKGLVKTEAIEWGEGKYKTQFSRPKYDVKEYAKILREFLHKHEGKKA